MALAADRDDLLEKVVILMISAYLSIHFRTKYYWLVSQSVRPTCNGPVHKRLHFGSRCEYKYV